MIKIRMLVKSVGWWNTWKSVYDSCDKDPNIDIKIVKITHDAGHARQNDIMKSYPESSSIPIDEYDIGRDNPDAFIVSFPGIADDNVRVLLGEAKKGGCIIVGLQVNLQMQFGLGWKKEYYFEVIKKNYFDYCLIESYFYQRLKNLGIDSSIIVEMGNPKYDGIWEKLNNHFEIQGEWNKLRGKKVFCYMTGGHGTRFINRLFGTTRQALDIYLKFIIQYFRNNEDAGLIFRPHPQLLRNILNNNVWSEADCSELRSFFKNSDNMVFDESAFYDEAFLYSDCILTEADTGICWTSLPTLKPVCMLYAHSKMSAYEPELTNHYYNAYNTNDLQSIMETIKNGDDPMYEERKRAAEIYIKHFDGKNGWRVREFIKNKVADKSQNRKWN